MRYATTRPIDLYAVVAVALVTPLVALALPWPPARVVLGLLFVLVAPGYALVAALFPERPRARRAADGETTVEGLEALERVALSLGLSIAVVPLLGLLLNYSPWGIRLVPILVAVSTFTLLLSAIAWIRRSRLPVLARLQFQVDVRPIAWSQSSPVERALTVALALAVLVAAGSLVYVATTPRASEAFTEFYVLGPDGKAEGYPTTLAPGANATVLLGIVDHEGSSVAYDVTASFVHGTFENESARTNFTEEGRVPAASYSVTLEDGAKDERNVTFTAPSTPGVYRLEFDLFRGADTAPYRELHLWIEVTP